MLHIVPLQLRLFPDSRHLQESESMHRGPSPRHRSPDEILRSVAAYLEWRAGISWRARFDAERGDYLDALRIVSQVRYLPAGLALAAAPLHKPERVPAEVDRLCGWDRSELVAELMAVDPLLTNRKLLSHLSKKKLATMLVDRWTAAARLERTA